MNGGSIFDGGSGHDVSMAPPESLSTKVQVQLHKVPAYSSARVEVARRCDGSSRAPHALTEAPPPSTARGALVHRGRSFRPHAVVGGTAHPSYPDLGRSPDRLTPGKKGPKEVSAQPLTYSIPEGCSKVSLRLLYLRYSTVPHTYWLYLICNEYVILLGLA